MVQLLPTGALAVKRPVEEMVPHLVAAHVTGTPAVNCCVPFCGVLGPAGEMVMGETTLMVVDATPLPSVAVAVTVQSLG